MGDRTRDMTAPMEPHEVKAHAAILPCPMTLFTLGAAHAPCWAPHALQQSAAARMQLPKYGFWVFICWLWCVRGLSAGLPQRV